MFASLLKSLFAFVFVWSGFLLAGIALLNLVFFNMRRSRIKKALKVGDFLVFAAAPPVFLLAFHDTALVGQLLALQPASAAARIILGFCGAAWFCAIAAQLFFSIRTALRKNPVQALSNRTRVERYHPSESDWERFRRLGAPEPLAAGMPAPPPHRRPVKPIPHRSPIRRIIRHTPLRHLDISYDLHIHEIVLSFPQLPGSFDGLRVLHLADSHYGALLSPRYYEFAIEHAGRLGADLIVLTGDYTADDYLHREAVALFQPLSAPLGVWTVLGNHDYYTDEKTMAYWIGHYGIRHIPNQRHDFRRGSDTLRLVGVEHPYQPVGDWQGLVGEADANTFCLVLSHRPENILPLARAGADLVLSGHTHGGQWRLPLLGPVFIPSFYGRHFDQGFFRVGRTLLYVSKGFGGHTFPLRLNCPPELTLFELRKGCEKQGPRPCEQC